MYRTKKQKTLKKMVCISQRIGDNDEFLQKINCQIARELIKIETDK